QEEPWGQRRLFATDAAERASGGQELGPSGQALGGAPLAYGPPGYRWHDSVVVGRMSALALRYFAWRATKRPMEAWKALVAAAGAGEAERAGRQRRRALQHWRGHAAARSGHLRGKLPLLRALVRLQRRALGPAWDRVRHAAAAGRDLERRLRLLHLIQLRTLDTMARARYYQTGRGNLRCE
ncbi:unnamed protein product, partial [Prorocentrum cordatum]